MSFKQFIDFIIKHWEFFSSFGLLIITLIVCLIKKKPVWNKMAAIFQDVLSRLPIFIDLVEKDGHGQEKLETVLAMVKSYVLETYKFNNFDDIRSWCINQIELILSTPQKKEV